MSWVSGHSLAPWVAIIAMASIAGCEAVSPRAINNGPYMIIPCILLCNTELAIETIDDNEGGVTGGDQSQNMRAGKAELPSIE